MRVDNKATRRERLKSAPAQTQKVFKLGSKISEVEMEKPKKRIL